MGDFVYDGAHSIDISGRDTWAYYKMAPQSRPFVAQPSVKTEYVDVPGADGQLDYTEVLTGGVRYGTRTGDWTFLVDNGYWDYPVLYSDLLSYLHGKKHKIILKDDPNYYYQGRLTITPNFGTKDYSTIKISYVLDPYKYPLSSTANMDWMWNDLFGNTILYGKFNVYKQKTRNLINQESSSKTVSLTLSSAMSVEFNGTTYNFPAGTTSEALTLASGNNIMTFKGSGQVTVDYSLGGML